MEAAHGSLSELRCLSTKGTIFFSFYENFLLILCCSFLTCCLEVQGGFETAAFQALTLCLCPSGIKTALLFPLVPRTLVCFRERSLELTLETWHSHSCLCIHSGSECLVLSIL